MVAACRGVATNHRVSYAAHRVLTHCPVAYFSQTELRGAAAAAADLERFLPALGVALFASEQTPLSGRSTMAARPPEEIRP